MTSTADAKRHRVKGFERGKLLGQGTFGKVFLCKDKYTNPNVASQGSTGYIAIKRAPKWTHHMSREICMLKQLGSPNNVVPLIDVFYTKKNESSEIIVQNLVFPYCSSSLGSYIRKHRHSNTQISPLTVKKIAYDIALGLQELHSKKIVHRDLKPDNILMDITKADVQCKICDLGSSKRLDNTASMPYICSRYYRAPELLFACSHYTESVDIWAYGCILLELIILQPLFPGRCTIVGNQGGRQTPGIDEPYQILKIMDLLGSPEVVEIENMIRNVESMKQHTIEQHLLQLSKLQIERIPFSDVFSQCTSDKSLLLLAEEILQWDPLRRPTVSTILKNPYFQDLTIAQ